jgi:small subunit ribosomal protein S8
MVNHPLSDLIIRIKNGIMRERRAVSIPGSKLKLEVIKLLKANNYLYDYKTYNLDNQRYVIRVIFRFFQKNNVINGLKVASKPSRAIHVKCRNMPSVLDGLGISVISSSKGIITNLQANKENVGGKVLMYIW